MPQLGATIGTKEEGKMFNPYGLPLEILNMPHPVDRIMEQNRALPLEPWQPVRSAPIGTHYVREEYANGYLGDRYIGNTEPDFLIERSAHGLRTLNHGEKLETYRREFEYGLTCKAKPDFSLPMRLIDRCEHGITGYCALC